MHKRIKRLFSLAAAFVLLLSSVFSASALTEGSNYSFNTAYTQVYYNWGSYQTADGAYHSASGQLALRTLKSTGEPIYCLQAHKGTTGSNASAKPLNMTSAWKDELSRIAQTGITWASIYGYRGNGINTYGYSAQNAQIATQMLIWEWQTTRRTSVGASASSYVTKAISGDALACYNKILEACRNHQNGVTWDKTSVTLNAAGESNAQYFTDASNRLSGFEISGNSNSSVVGASISGNKLKVWAKSATSATASIILTKKMTNIGSAMCLTGAGQTMFYGAVKDPVDSYVTVKVNGTYTLQLQKTVNAASDTDKTFSFEIKRSAADTDNPSGLSAWASPQLTVKAGSLSSEIKKFSDCDPNYWYYIRETGQSDGYIINESGWSGGSGWITDSKTGVRWYKFKPTAGSTVTVTAANTRKEPLYLQKKFVGQAQAELERTGGGEFSFSVYAGQSAVGEPIEKITVTVDDESFIESAVTDKGEALEIGQGNTVTLAKELAPGWYTVRETLTDEQISAGWIKPAVKSVYVQAGGKNTVEMSNNYIAGLTVLKKTTDHGSVEGFHFFLIKHRASGDVVNEDVTDRDGYIDFGKVTAEELVTDYANGVEYELIEIAEQGYKLPTQCTFATVGAQQTVSMTETEYNGEKAASAIFVPSLSLAQTVEQTQMLEINVNNEYETGEIEISKTGDSFSSVEYSDGIYTPVFSKSGLSGAKFQIYAAEDIKLRAGTDYEEVIYKAGTAVGEEVTADQDGKVRFEKLFPGKYRISETYTPEGYVTAEDITVTALGGKTETAGIHNAKQKVKVSLTKLLQTTGTLGQNGELNDVVFGIYAAEALTAQDDSVIPADGLIETLSVNVADGVSSAVFANRKDLPFGKYYLKEIATNGHYMLDDTRHEFTVDPANPTETEIAIDLDPVTNFPKGTITGMKRDTSGKIAEGCEFSLYAKSDITDVNGNVIHRAGELVDTAVSDENGEFTFADLYYGEYRIAETKVPDGYVLPDTDVVGSIGISADAPEQQTEVTNKFTTASFIKYDENGEPLAGAEFILVTKQDISYGGETYKAGDTVDTWTTTTEPKVWEYLPFGDYEIIETKAPAGYELYDKAIPFTLTNDDYEVSLSASNIRRTPVMTGGIGDFPFMLAGNIMMGVAAIGVSFMFVYKKKKSR